MELLIILWLIFRKRRCCCQPQPQPPRRGMTPAGFIAFITIVVMMVIVGVTT